MKTAQELRVMVEAARSRRDGFASTGPADPALSRVGATLHRQITRRNDVALRRYVEADLELQNLEVALARAGEREREAARVRLAFEDVRGARAVRDQFGWHKVVRVSGKSVTVETAYSWTDRIVLDKILEVAR